MKLKLRKIWDSIDNKIKIKSLGKTLHYSNTRTEKISL